MTERLYVEANNGGTSIVIGQDGYDNLEIEVDHNCVHVGKWKIPAYVFADFMSWYFNKESFEEMKEHNSLITGEFSDMEMKR